MNEDPRLGLPSASRFETLALCPGSEQLRRSLDPATLASNDSYSETGRTIHKARETGNILPLDEGELEIYKRGMATEKDILQQWLEDYRIETYAEAQTEQRLFLNDPATMQPVTSGQLDVLYVAPPYALVIDWKSLWCTHLTPSDRNWQGKLQAVLVANEYDLEHVRMAFNKAMFGKADQCDYNLQGLAYAEFSIRQALWEAEQPGAPLRPGSQCIFCPCKAHCPEAISYATLPAMPAMNGDPLTLVNVVPIESLAGVWRKKGVITKIFEAINKRFLELPAEELTRLGFKRTDGRKLDSIKDVPGAFAMLIQAGLDETAILNTMSIGKGDLTKAIQEFKQVRKAEAEAWIDAQLDQFIERKRSAPSLAEL